MEHGFFGCANPVLFVCDLSFQVGFCRVKIVPILRVVIEQNHHCLETETAEKIAHKSQAGALHPREVEDNSIDEAIGQRINCFIYICQRCFRCNRFPDILNYTVIFSFSTGSGINQRAETVDILKMGD